MNKLISYIKESIAEMKKVVWPSKKQTTTYTIVVIGMSIGVALFFGLLDYAFNLGLQQIITK
jgi:preprotein translocase subunit SecE